MRKLGWILVLTLCLCWAYLDLFGAKTLTIMEEIINKNDDLRNSSKTSKNYTKQIEAGYVPGKSPDAQKAEDHIKLSLMELPEDGPVAIISKRILVPPREDGSWTEEWVVEKGKTQIPIKIEFGLKD